jgi:hypothetical protein
MQNMDLFDERYTPVSLESTEFDGDMQGAFETFGADLEYVLSVANGPKPRCVWTMVDSEDGDGMILLNGYHIVNRVYYIVTTEEGQGESYYDEW